MKEDISNLSKEINEYQKEIFKILLKISKSFSNKKIIKQDRDEMFFKIDTLKEEIKKCNKKIKEINNTVKNNEENSLVQEKEIKDINGIKSDDLDNDLNTLEDNIKKIEKIKEESENQNKEDTECKIIPLTFKNNTQNIENDNRNNQLMIIEKENKNIIFKIFRKIKLLFKK